MPQQALHKSNGSPEPSRSSGDAGVSRESDTNAKSRRPAIPMSFSHGRWVLLACNKPSRPKALAKPHPETTLLQQSDLGCEQGHSAEGS